MVRIHKFNSSRSRSKKIMNANRDVIDEPASSEAAKTGQQRIGACSFAIRQQECASNKQAQRQHRNSIENPLHCKQNNRIAYQDHARLSQPLQKTPEAKCGSRLLPVVDHDVENNSIKKHHHCHHKRQHQHERHQRHSAGRSNLLPLFLSLVVSFSLASVVLCSGSSGGIAPDSGLREATRIQRRPYEQQSSITSQTDGLNDDRRNNDDHTNHQPTESDHTNCPYRTMNSHKSQLQQQQHHHHLHYNQVRSGSSTTSISSLSDDSADEGNGHLDERHVRAHYQLDADERPHARSASKGAREFQGTIGGASSQRAAKGNNDEADKQTKTATTATTATTGHYEPACDDCLAIPLVALVGDKQINGFIIPPASLQRQTSHESQTNYPRPEQHRAQQQQQDTLYRKEPLNARRYNQQQHVYKSYEPIAVSLEPKSDDECPMTGPLTVCDHIGSYPTDVILNKLNIAKKRLGQSQFNLESFFTDERDNSGDPFESQKKVHPAHHHRQATNMTVTGMANVTSNEYAPDSSANIYSHPIDDNQQPTKQPERRTRANKGYNNVASTWPADFAHHQAAMIYPSRPERIQPDSMHDDLVDLVERQAISLTDRRKDSSYRRTSKAATDHQSQHHSDRLSGAAEYQKRALIGDNQGSILDSNRTQVKSRMGSFSAVRPSTATATASANRQSTKSLTKTTTKTTIIGRHNSAATTSSYDGSRLPVDSEQVHSQDSWPVDEPARARKMSQRSWTESIDSANSSLSSSIAIRPSRLARGRREQQTNLEVSARKEARRSRRQVASVRVTASSGRPMLASETPQRRPVMSSNSDTDGDNTDTDTDTDRGDSDANEPPSSAQPDSNDNQAEPVCRTRSIYISPKAALNDKKQWKYVVNAPERNPRIRQIIRVDICQDPFGPCSEQVSIPFGFTSECKQKYSKKKLLALDAKSGLLEVDTFFIPSCCVCQLIRTDTNPIEDTSAAGDIDTNSPSSAMTTTTTASASASSDQAGEDNGR